MAILFSFKQRKFVVPYLISICYFLLFNAIFLSSVAQDVPDVTGTRNERRPESSSLEVTSKAEGNGSELDHKETPVRNSGEANFLRPAAFAAMDSPAINLRNSLWIPKNFHTTCCLGGTPMINHPELVHNFTYTLMNYVIDEKAGETGDDFESENAANLNCRVFHGSYSLPAPAVFNLEQLSYAIQVICKCPEIGTTGHVLDRNCRRLPACKNNGFRSLIDPRKCLCLQPFFGTHCEKICDQGQRLRGLNGRDYCSCSPFYKGVECREMVCLNGGREENGRCICPAQYLGYHCEIDTNRTGTHEFGHTNPNSRFQRFGDQGHEMFTRDISGTIFSLIMIVVLVVSMYLLMKHRMQVQSRYINRRPDLLGACNFPIVPSSNAMSAARRVELMTTADDHLPGRPFQFRTLRAAAAIVGDGGPPPYTGRGRRGRDEALPPLPSYEDATKLPPLRQSGVETEERAAAPDPTEAQPAAALTVESSDACSRISSQSSSSAGTPTHTQSRSPMQRRGSSQSAETLRDTDEQYEDERSIRRELANTRPTLLEGTPESAQYPSSNDFPLNPLQSSRTSEEDPPNARHTSV
ncbi:sushi, von Willebrand factor type A, EGF and pentraxin domain-containing protein 1 [Ditylenchus destructor]|uniref:Sushi, von Willebrand factor type A, EGF and pentraxin domain-containing protein 1 n=1 Tax=Ditylenchus destructor TaxID=166010 RepID=A0AAD4RAD6_9BILA|nr:sushi, von Willebrand factor type A, EGF and pentraxin domain-containing protein 1 [Ditylenchus destructor]